MSEMSAGPLPLVPRRPQHSTRLSQRGVHAQPFGIRRSEEIISNHSVELWFVRQGPARSGANHAAVTGGIEAAFSHSKVLFMEEFIMEVLNVVAIIVAGLMVGNELAIAAFVHPTLDKLPDDVHLPAASALARVLGSFMPS